MRANKLTPMFGWLNKWMLITHGFDMRRYKYIKMRVNRNGQNVQRIQCVYILLNLRLGLRIIQNAKFEEMSLQKLKTTEKSSGYLAGDTDQENKSIPREFSQKRKPIFHNSIDTIYIMFQKNSQPKKTVANSRGLNSNYVLKHRIN